MKEPNIYRPAVQEVYNVERLEKLLASRTTIYATRRVTGGPLGGNGGSSVAMDA